MAYNSDLYLTKKIIVKAHEVYRAGCYPSLEILIEKINRKGRCNIPTYINLFIRNF